MKKQRDDMARKQSAKKKPVQSHPGLRLARAFALRWGCWALVTALAMCALALGAERAWTALAASPEFIVSADNIALPCNHPILNGDAMARELRREVGQVMEGKSIFDPDLCGQVDRELRASPWVLDVRSVRRLLPNRLRIDMVFRAPVALVSYGRRTYMLDCDGRCMPDGVSDGLYRRPERWQRPDAPVLVNRRLNSRPERGLPWGGPALVAGARFYEYLSRAHLFAQLPIKTIDVTGVGHRDDPDVEPEIVLKTAAGVQIKWGRSDVYRQVAGLAQLAPLYRDDRKLAMLRDKLAEYPGLSGLQYIDLRFNKIFMLPADTPEPGDVADPPRDLNAEARD